MKWFSNTAPVLVMALVTCGVVIGYLQHTEKAEGNQKLNQFNQLVAPDNNAIMTDDTVLRSYVKEYGPAPTMRTIINASTSLGIECHNRAHQFGRMSFEEYGDEILKLNLPECHSGFYHGAIEAYFKKYGTDKLKEKIDTVCPPEMNDFFMHQCRHGLGHGLMAWSSYDLPGTLEYCNFLDDPAGQASCRTGAFMENVVGSLTDSEEARALGHFTKFLSDDPQYPCTIVKDEYKADCYFLQTDRMLQLSPNGYQFIVDQCSLAPEAYQYTCFASMGRTVSGQMRGRPAEALAACQLIPNLSYRAWCIDGISKDQLWDPSGQDNGLAFCALVPPEDGRDVCYQGLISQAHSVMTKEQIEGFCPRLPSEYQETCFSIL